MIVVVGEYRFKVKEKVLISPNGESVPVRDQLARILTALIDAKGDVVSLSALELAVWGNNHVADATVKAEITGLRKLFGEHGSEYIKNVRAKGYYLNAAIEEITVEEDFPSLDIPAPQPEKRAWFIGVALAFLVIIGLSLFLIFRSGLETDGQPSVFSDPTITPLTDIQGAEISPALSHDKRYLAFSHQHSDRLSYRLKVKDLANNRVVEFNEAEFSAGAVWGKDDTFVYYLTYHEERCTVVRRKHVGLLLFNEPEKLADCGTAKMAQSLALDSDNNWLFFTFQDAQSGTYVIKRTHLVTGAVQQLTTAIDEIIGDYSFALSPDGNLVAALSADANSRVRLRVLNLKKGDFFEVKRLDFAPHEISWDQDNRHLYYAKAQYIEKLDTFTGQTVASYKAPVKVKTPRFVERDTFLVSYGNIFKDQASVWHLDEETFVPKALENSSFDDYFPLAISLENAEFAFVSNRRGNRQLWYAKGAVRNPLTTFAEHKKLVLYDVSPDKSAVLLRADGELILVDIASGKALSLFQAANPVNDAIWHCGDNTQLLAITKIDGIWTLVSVDLAKDNKITPLMEGVVTVKADCDSNSYYITKSAGSGVFKLSDSLDATSFHAEFDLPSFALRDKWVVQKERIFYIDEGEVYAYDLRTKETIKLSGTHGYISTISASKGSLLFTERKLNDNHIAELVF